MSKLPFITLSIQNIFLPALNYEGVPQPYDQIKEYSKKDAASRNKSDLDEPAWTKHIQSLKQMSILAHQASEYEYNKQRTEGKTGIVKPDLIPVDSLENLTISPLNTSTPIKPPAPTEVLTSPRRKRSTISNSLPIKTHSESGQNKSPKKSPVTLVPKKLFTEAASPTKESVDAPKQLSVPSTVPKSTKPPNILIYSMDSKIFDSTVKTLKDVLEPEM